MSKLLRSLDQVEVVALCHEPWDAMRTVDRTRRNCATCAKHVHDVSALTRAEAERLVSAGDAAICVRFVRGVDGRVLTREDFSARSRRARIGSGTLRRVAMLAAGIGLGAFFNLGCDRERPPTVFSGEIAVPNGAPTTLPTARPTTAPATRPSVAPVLSPLTGMIAPLPPAPPRPQTRTAAMPKHGRRP